MPLERATFNLILLKLVWFAKRAEEVRFELTIGLRLCRFSKPVPSTTQPLFPACGPGGQAEQNYTILSQKC